MSKRGLSFEEKKVRLLEYMQEHLDVYSLKELENSASKAKGIVSQTIKEVLQHLIADGVVEEAKIGSGNFYWSLPSKAKIVAHNRIDKAESDLASAQALNATLLRTLADAQASRPTTDKRTADLKRLYAMKEQSGELNASVDKYADADPDRLAKVKAGTIVCKAAANRWTDNLNTLMTVMSESSSEMDESTLRENYGLPKDFDYLP